MGEKIFDLVKNLATGKHSKIFWGILIIIIVLSIIVFPYIDANFLYYSRIEKRIDNLIDLVELSGKGIEESVVLFAEYNNIIEEIKVAQDRSMSTLFENKEDTTYEYWAKFLSGASLFWLIGVVILLQKDKSHKLTFSYFIKNNFFIFTFCIVIGGLIGFIFSKLPTLGTVWVNVVCVPVLQFIVAYFLLNKSENKTQT